MRRVICTVGAIALLIALVVTIGLMIGTAVCSIDGSMLWKAGIIELIGMAVCYLGIGDWMDE